MTEDQTKQLVETYINEHSATAWKDVIVAGFDSTVLIFLIFIIVLYIFRNQVSALLRSRNIEINWGDKNIKLNELSNNFDQEIDPLRDEIETLKNEISELQSKAGIAATTPATEVDREAEIQLIKKRMYKALGSPKFRWRSTSKLALFSRTTEEQIMELISADDSIQIGYDKHGNRLAKFKHR